MGVGIDREPAVVLDREVDEFPRWVEAFRSAVDLDRGAEPARMLRTRSRRRTSTAGASRSFDRCSGRGCRRGGGRSPCTMRSVIGWRSMRNFECTLATTMSSRASISSERSSEPSSKMSTSMPVRIRKSWPAEAISSLIRSISIELVPEPLLVQPMGDREPCRVIGQHHVLVTQLDRSSGHRVDPGAAVTPRRVQVAIAPERRSILGTGVAEWDLGLGFDLSEVRRYEPGQGFGDDEGRGVADAVELGQSVVACALGKFDRVGGADHVEGTHERLRLETRCQRPIETVDDPEQRPLRCHGPSVVHEPDSTAPVRRSGCVTTATVDRWNSHQRRCVSSRVRDFKETQWRPARSAWTTSRRR